MGARGGLRACYAAGMDEATLSTREVAARLGLHPSTVSRRRKRGELVAREVSRGDGTYEWRYPAGQFAAAPPAQPPRVAGHAGPGAGPGAVVVPAGLLEEVRRLGALEALTTMQAMRIRELEAEVAALRGAAPARRPWWRRLFGKTP